MPIFEYQCEACDHEFEMLVLDSKQPDCPECDGQQLTKLFSAPAAPVMKGGALPMAACPPSDAPPCNPHCCRLP
jgi:putative FmdB family regulatory protein